MAKCCSGTKCSCIVSAGAGVSVTGSGSIAAPYVVTSSASPASFTVTDSATVDLALTGDGGSGSAYDLTATVRLDAAPPGGANLLQTGPAGLSLERADVRGCVTAGNGAGYDSATGVITGRLSTDEGNSATYGSDGGLLVPATELPDPTALEVQDTPSLDLSLTGTGTAADPYEVSGTVRLDPAPAGGPNLLRSGPAGLSLERADVRGCLTASDGAAYDPGTGAITSRLSTDAGNEVRFGGDGGLYVPAAVPPEPTALGVQDSASLDLSLTGTGTAADPYEVSGTVRLDPAPSGGPNLLQSGPAGLSLESADVRGCLTAGNGAGYDSATGAITGRLSTEPGNEVRFGGDGGLYVPAPTPPAPTALGVEDSASLDLSLTGTGTAADPYEVSGTVRLDPAPAGGTNLLQAGPAGLSLECADVRGCLTAGNGAAYNSATGAITGRLSADASNTATFGSDGGLFVPPAPAPTVGCGITGTGSAGSPLTVAPVAGQQPWTTDWDCDPATNSTLRCDPTSGKLWTPPEHSSAAASASQIHSISASAISTTAWKIINNNAWSEGEYTADSLTTCRGVSFALTFTGHVEVTWPASAVFELGYAVSINGATSQIQRMASWLQSSAAAGHQLVSFSLHQAVVLPAHTGYSVVVYPSIRVGTGSATINQWITDIIMIAVTQ